MESDNVEKVSFLEKRNTNNDKKKEKLQESTINNLDVKNRKRSQFEGKYVDKNKRNSSVVWDMDLWLTLGDCKRIYKLRIQDYLNDMLRQKLEIDYPDILKHNSNRGIQW
jgi:hypothetical protein